MNGGWNGPAVGERGAVTAEFAVALPVVAVVLAVGVGGVAVVDAQGRLQAAAVTAARAIGRGDDAAGRRALRTAGAASVRVVRPSGLVCVHAARAAAQDGPFAALELRGSACSVDEYVVRDGHDEHDQVDGGPAWSG
ncbi:pilus assembly protein [Curtobacterium sp. MCBD17_032]|uniref:pilus assembly protein n=1 Tax=Curtobacterium sp. MCBD17_032 TaxID=2175659 RepID=UPI000DAA9CF9|nr:pilus assembly protein [Curtobacterium sp. MCBD17_032]PZE85036.1 pilus assembly protein [Curtobacterium sp. MCBD17_032]